MDAFASVLPTPFTLTLPLAAGGAAFAGCIDPDTAAELLAADEWDASSYARLRPCSAAESSSADICPSRLPSRFEDDECGLYAISSRCDAKWGGEGELVTPNRFQPAGGELVRALAADRTASVECFGPRARPSCYGGRSETTPRVADKETSNCIHVIPLL